MPNIKVVMRAQADTVSESLSVQNASELDILAANSKINLSSGIDQIPADQIQEKGEVLCFRAHMTTNVIWNKKWLPLRWKEGIAIQIYKKGDNVDFNVVGFLLIRIFIRRIL
jgi:hypothetical protein